MTQIWASQVLLRSQGQVRWAVERAQGAGESPASGEEWCEHHVATIAGVKFYQRVQARTWPEKMVDLTWKVVNTNNHPVWHSLEESKPNSELRSYLWGGSDLKPGASHTHVSVSYEPGRSDWRFEGFVRRED